MPHPLSADTDVLRGTSRIYRETIDRLTPLLQFVTISPVSLSVEYI